MGCLFRIGLAFFMAVGAAPWGAYLAAREPSLASVPDAPWIGLGAFAILGGLVGWVVGGVAWKALRTVVLVLVILVAIGLSWSGWQSWIHLPVITVP